MFYECPPAAGPLISKRDQKARLASAKKHFVWTNKNLKRVFFTNENKFNLVTFDSEHCQAT